MLASRRVVTYIDRAGSAAQKPRKGAIWSRLQAPEAHQKRGDLVPNAATRSPSEEGRSGPECRLQRPTSKGMIWSRQQAPEAHQKRDETVPTAGSRGPPEVG